MSRDDSEASAPAGLAKYISTHASFRHASSSTSPLPALYSDLSRQRKSNPAGYRASIEWWKGTLIDVTWRGVQLDRDPPVLDDAAGALFDDDLHSASGEALPDRTVFRLDESTKARWTVDGVGRPLGLGTVLAELEKTHAVVALSKFRNSTTAVSGPAKQSSGLRGYIPTAGGVASALLVTPARWAASQLLSLATGASDDDEGEYSQDEQLFRSKRGDWVVYELVHRLASAWLTHHFEHDATLSPISSLMTEAEFRQRLARVCARQFGFHPSERDAQLVLTHLVRDCAGVATTHAGVVKFSAAEGVVVERVSEEDRGVVAVKETVRKVELQIGSLQRQIDARTQQAKDALRKGSKQQAASYLRSRKALDEVLTKRMATRETMAKVLLGIEQAKSDVEIVKAYEASSDVLARVLARPELKMDHVDKTMEGLEQSLASQREVDEAIRATAPTDIDEDEVQHELDQLLAEKSTAPTTTPHTQHAAKPQHAAKAHDATLDQDLLDRFNNLRLPPTTNPTNQTDPTDPTDPTEQTRQQEHQQPISE